MKYLKIIIIVILSAYGLSLFTFSRPLKHFSFRHRQIQYRFFLAELLEKLGKEKDSKKKKNYLKYFHLYRWILRDLYSNLKYSFLMQELKIPKKAVIYFIRTGNKTHFLQVLLNLKDEVFYFKKKLLSLKEPDLSIYLKKLKISSELFSEIQSW